MQIAGHKTYGAQKSMNIPNVGATSLISSPFSFLNMVVFPPLSRPRTNIRSSFSFKRCFFKIVSKPIQALELRFFIDLKDTIYNICMFLVIKNIRITAKTRSIQRITK